MDVFYFLILFETTTNYTVQAPQTGKKCGMQKSNSMTGTEGGEEEAHESLSIFL